MSLENSNQLINYKLIGLLLALPLSLLLTGYLAILRVFMRNSEPEFPEGLPTGACRRIQIKIEEFLVWGF